MATWSEPSPFLHGGPVPPDQLVGRQRETLALRRWAVAGRCVALTALPRYGTTSLIGKVAAEAERVDRMAVVVADLFDVASLADLVIRLERAWARHTPDRLRPAVDAALAGAKVGLSIAGPGFTVALADRPDTNPLPALHALLDLPTRLAGHRGHGRVLVVLDGFGSLARVAGAEALLAHHAEQQRSVATYLFAASQPGGLVAAFGDSDRPFRALRGRVETLRLGRLPVGELVEAIDLRFRGSDRDPGDVLADLVPTSEGHPQRAMLLAHLLWTRTRPGQVADRDTWAGALSEALRQVDAEVRAVTSGLSPGQRKTLRAVAEYGSPLNSRARRTLNLPKATANQAAESLVADGVLEREQGRWRVVDPLLARWIAQQMPTRPRLH
jgi:hypothetical protein